MVLFGWRFRSPAALCMYYRINVDHFRTEWRARTPGTAAYAMPSVMRGIAVLWELGRLDERNRQLPEVEKRLPKSCLPTNDVLDEARLSEYERRNLDCLQPEGVVTERRHGLAWLARMRQRARS
jgi:hypothetical protein